MCPRRFIKENPYYWSDAISAYNAFEKGFMPNQGGTDDQPALFQAIMSTIATALSEEDEYERLESERIKKVANASNRKNGNRSLVPPTK